MRESHKQNGFTLIELSIVLVIIGLIVGGVLVGQDLVKAAQLRAVISQTQEFQTALNAFKAKYNAIPGDMKNATTFWGAEPGANCPGDDSTPSTTTATCNGNGNKQIAWQGSAGFGREAFRFWQHLANAGYISGQYTGTHSAGGCGYCNVETGVNVPASEFTGATWSVIWFGVVSSGSSYHYQGNYGSNHFYLGKVANYPSNPIFTPTEAWKLDTKIDDGRPGLGVVRAWKSSRHPNCSDNNDPTLSEYILTNDDQYCALLIDTMH